MAKNDNLSDFMTDIADAIRAKKGTSEPINAQDFSTEIASIQTGGGGSSMEYWSFPNGLEDDSVAMFATLAKYTALGATLISPPAIAPMFNVEYKSFVGIAFNIDLKIIYGGFVGTLGDFIAETGLDLAAKGGVQITEEEFYSIN